MLLDRLDITILTLKEVLTDNEKLRIDDGYFSKLAVFTQRRIENLPHIRFGVAASVFRKGIFDIKASNYVESGVPFVRIGDLKQGLIEVGNIAYIPREIHDMEAKTALSYGDIILSKTAYAAASFVNLEQCNVSQDTIAIKLSPLWRDKLRTGFVVAFLDSRHGMSLMERQFQGNMQRHLALPDAKKIPIPLFSDDFQQLIHSSFEDANEKFQKAAAESYKAEQILMRALGLEGWQPPEPLTYTRRASEAFAAERLDAEYFSPHVKDLITHLNKDGLKVGNVAPQRKEQFNPGISGDFDYLEISDLRSDGTVSSKRLPRAEAPSRATWHVHKGDVITSMVRPIRCLSALILQDQEDYVCSSGFIVLRPVSVSSELLLTYLRLPIICELMDLHTSASMYPAISEQDLLNIPFRAVDSIYEDDIIRCIQKVQEAHNRARTLLERAKQAVEIALEQGEAAALDYMMMRD